MYIILAVLAFGILIASHEFGHFIAAKACGVKVNEFSIGMGPAIYKRQKGETLYALRALPIGGYCAMEGEDEEKDDPRAFTSQALWKKLIILVAGAFMNFVLGVIIIFLVYSNATVFVSPTVDKLVDGFKYGGESGLMEGDTVISIDGHRIFYSNDFSTYMSRSTDGTVDMVVMRDGNEITLENYALRQETYVIDGEELVRYGITFKTIEATALEKTKYSLYTAYNFIRMVQMSFSDLISGAAGIQDMAGVVGIVDVINDVGTSSPTVADGLLNIAYLCSFVAICLAITNLLPIPALDGGRVFLLIVTWIVEKITRKHVDPKYEGYIHAAGMVLLLGLMAVVMFNDIARVING